MLFAIATILIPIVLALLFFWLARRAWGSRNAIVKWVGVILAGLLTLIFALVTILGAVGLVIGEAK